MCIIIYLINGKQYLINGKQYLINEMYNLIRRNAKFISCNVVIIYKLSYKSYKSYN